MEQQYRKGLSRGQIMFFSGVLIIGLAIMCAWIAISQKSFNNRLDRFNRDYRESTQVEIVP